MERIDGVGSRLVVSGRPITGGFLKLLYVYYRKAGINVASLTFVIGATDVELAKVFAEKQWSRIDLIGNEALKQVTGKSDGIMKWRGCSLPVKGEQTARCIAILPPEYLVKDSQMVPATISDLTKGTAIPPQAYNVRPTVEDLQAFSANTLVFDIETNWPHSQITVVGIADSKDSSHVLVVPFNGNYIGELRRIFTEADAVVGQNIIGFDLGHLADNNIKIKPDCQIWDTMLMHHLMHPDEPHDLEYIASIYTQMVYWKHTMGKDLAWYNACDVDATGQIFNQLLPLLKRFNLLDLYKYTQVPIAKICKQMSETGIKVDPAGIKKAREKAFAELHEQEALLPKELQAYEKPIKIRQKAPEGTLGKAGKPIKFIHIPGTEEVVPWQSPKKVEEYLYGKLKIEPYLHPKTKKPTTDKNALEKIFKKTGNLSIKAIMKVRQLDELITTFLKDGDEDKQVAIGRIHANFLVHGTSTGRLASSGPNMQNIPPAAKYAYVPSNPDWCFIEADFSSLENRLAAYFANDEGRLHRLSIQGFNEHRWLASQIYKIPESEIDKKSMEYDRAKHTNHGADAGMGPRKMSIQYNVPEKDCKSLLLMWKELNAPSARWQEKTGNEAIAKGILTTAFGRKRWFWNHSAYTEGIRFMLQSSGADICFRSMVGLMYDRIGWPEESARKVSPILIPLPKPARLVCQIHDSLLVECPYAIVEEVKAALTAVMSQPWPELAGYNIPIALKVGAPSASWADLKEG